MNARFRCYSSQLVDRGSGLLRRLGLILLLCAVLQPSLASAEKEYAVKAAFLFHFLNFVTWPADAFGSPDAPFNLCLAGGDPFGESINPIAAKQAQGRSIRVVRNPDTSAPRKCQAVFIYAESPEDLDSLLETWSARGVLTIGDGQRFHDRGGVIGYVMRGSSVRFILNDEAAKQANLGLSVKLRKVALGK